jgi:hypothetical protein
MFLYAKFVQFGQNALAFFWIYMFPFKHVLKYAQKYVCVTMYMVSEILYMCVKYQYDMYSIQTSRKQTCAVYYSELDSSTQT